MTTWKKLFVSMILASVVGACAYGITVNFLLMQSFDKSYAAVTSLRSAVLTKLLTYGTVQSSDPDRHTVTVLLPSLPTAGARSIVVTVTGSTVIQKQELLADQNGAFTGIAPLSAGTVADLTPGTRVAITFQKSGDGLEATLILFGNPL